MAKKDIRDIKVTGKRVLVRVDFNVPLDDKDGTMVITDDTRIRETLPTLHYLVENGAKVILCSHLGRPKGQVDLKQSLRPVAVRLAELLSIPVAFSSVCVGPEAVEKSEALDPGEVLLLENVRFMPGEEINDPELAKQFAELANIYVNDAFGSAHRAHASTEGVAHLVPTAVSGLLMEKELHFLGDELEAPAKPFVVILGGAKVSDKIQVIDALLEKADTILIGGGMAYTFGLALGKKIGKSLSEPDKVETANLALAKAKEKGVKFLLPVDNYIVETLDFKNKTVRPGKYTAPGEGIPDGWEGVDIGPETIKLFSAEIASAKTVLWNGPMGVFEIKECAKGTFALAEVIAQNQAAKTIIGGGDSVKAVKRAGVSDKVTFISTGGGASLELLEGKVLPGVAALADK
ncbi:MAG TPA: phosphoglycerate kinase [Chthoniobacterales bacterium]